MRRTLPTALAITALSLAEETWAGSEPVLLLPLRDALVLIERPSGVGSAAAPSASSRWRGPAPGAPPPPPGFIPKRIHIPDLYRLDYERDAPRFAEPVDNDRLVALELAPASGPRPSVAFTYDTESQPIGDSSKRISIRFELPF